MDMQYAENAFEAYLDQYDRTDDKIKLKIDHTYGVVRCMDAITEKMGLDAEDRQIARLIALLHDIGRFEQLKRFGSFEPGVMDHAAYGIRILFSQRGESGSHASTDIWPEEGMIRKFIKEDTFDEIIRTAIAKHSDYRLEGIEDERVLLHARLIRDADKLDNCRVKLEDDIETMLDLPAKEVGCQKISPQVMQQVFDKKAIDNRTRRTKMDYWVSYVAYFFDINFKETLQIIDRECYVDRIIDRIPYGNPETKQDMQKIGTFINEYIKNKIRE